MRHRLSIVDLAIFLTLAIIAVVGYKVSPSYPTKADLTIEPATGCDLNAQSCAADLPGGGRVELSLTPHPIPVIKPLQVSVELTGITANKLEIDFSGVEMNMGSNRVTLLAGKNGRFSASAMLPVCVSGRMAWRATLLVKAEHQRIAVPFLFEAPATGG